MTPRILFIGTICPFGDVSGAGLRTRNILRLLGRIGEAKAVFVTNAEWDAAQHERTCKAFNVETVGHYLQTPHGGWINRLRNVFDPRYLNTHCLLAPDAVRTSLDAWLAASDLVWLHTFKPANALRRYHWPASVMDVDDFPSRFHRSAARHARSTGDRLLRWQRAASWRLRERCCLERFDLLTVCKEADRDAFGDPSRVHAVPNGFEPPDVITPNELRRGDRIGMIGDFTYLPNHDGLRWFVRHAWPLVRARVPAAQLRLVGKGGAELAAEFPDSGVVGLGYVADVAEEIGTWGCMIVPTRLGGGTHLKVAEALARRVPMVVTTHGSRGYDLVSERHAFVADSAADQARACISLLTDPGLRERVADDGWRLFQKSYSWDSIQPSVERVVEHCLRRKHSGG